MSILSDLGIPAKLNILAKLNMALNLSILSYLGTSPELAVQAERRILSRLIETPLL
jgi:hypothetical protein